MGGASLHVRFTPRTVQDETELQSRKPRKHQRWGVLSLRRMTMSSRRRYMLPKSVRIIGQQVPLGTTLWQPTACRNRWRDQRKLPRWRLRRMANEEQPRSHWPLKIWSLIPKCILRDSPRMVKLETKSRRTCPVRRSGGRRHDSRRGRSLVVECQTSSETHCDDWKRRPRTGTRRGSEGTRRFVHTFHCLHSMKITAAVVVWN